MLKRLPSFALDMGMRPADVWALTTDEFVVLATAVDVLAEQRAQAVSRAGR